MARKSKLPSRGPDEPENGTEGTEGQTVYAGSDSGNRGIEIEDRNVGEAPKEEKGTDADAITGPAPEKRRRGRPPGSGTKKEKPSGLAITPLIAADLKGKIQGLHVMLAMFTNQPIFQLTDDECNNLANAIVEVSKHYNINFATGPRMALVNLAAVAGMIYIPRIVMIAKQRKTIKQPESINPVETMAGEQIMPEAVQPQGQMDFGPN